MLQIQYYNKGLTQTQIEQILNNYNLKYTTISKQINAKLNSLIKTVLDDIFPFLENIQVLSKEIKKMKDLENTNDKIEFLENKLRKKAETENQLKNDIITLKKEISFLKQKNNQNNLDTLSYKNECPPTSPRNKSKIRKKSYDINIDEKQKTIKNINDNNGDKNKQLNNSNLSISNSSKNFNLNNHSKSTIGRTNSIKNTKNKNNYMMNMQEITRSINGYHNQIQNTRNNEKVRKFICFSSKKNYKKDIKNKKIKSKKEKGRSIDLSYSVDTDTKNKKIEINNTINNYYNNNINNNNANNNYNNNNVNKVEENSLEIIEEEYDEEIRELEIDEENILKLIEDIKKFENNIEVADPF